MGPHHPHVGRRDGSNEDYTGEKRAVGQNLNQFKLDDFTVADRCFCLWFHGGGVFHAGSLSRCHGLLGHLHTTEPHICFFYYNRPWVKFYW